MKIAFFIAETGAGGAENQLLLLLENLPKNEGNNYLLFYIREGKRHNEFMSIANIEFIKIENFQIPFVRYFVMSNKIKKVILQQQINIVYSWLFEASFLTYLANKKKIIKQIVALRVDILSYPNNIRNHVLNFIYKKILSNVDCIISNAKSSIDNLKAKISLSDYHIIPNILTPIEFYDESNMKKKKIILGTLSRLTTQKEPYKLIDSIDILQRNKKIENIQVDWVGAEGDIKSVDVLQYAKIKNVNFNYLGEKKNRFEYMEDFDIAFLFSSNEGVSNFLIESMIAGKKIVATDVGDNKYILDPRTSIIVPRGDVEAFADAIYELLHRDIKQEILDEVAQNVIDTYTVKKNIQMHFEVFYKVFNK